MGSKRKLGFIAAGRDAFALESMVLSLAGLRQEDSRPLKAAIERGVCPEGAGWFQVLGDDPARLAIDEFKLPARNYFSERVPAILTERVARHFSARPRPAPELCTGCGRCLEICPRKAITLEKGVASVKLKRCIRCFCCEELCEEGAMRIKTPLFRRR